jgi:hypothetical protein
MQSLAELALKMHESVDLADEREVKKFLGFSRVGENLVGVRRRATRLMEEDALEIGPAAPRTTPATCSATGTSTTSTRSTSRSAGSRRRTRRRGSS